MRETTTMRISRDTKKRLQELMQYGETLDSKINDLINLYHNLKIAQRQNEIKPEPVNDPALSQFFWK